MLQITIPATELWDEINEKFISVKEQTLTLEHSLVSLSKWESKWHRPFLSKEEKTFEESTDYIRCMTLTQNVDPNVYMYLTNENRLQIRDYIEDPMTATRISDTPSKRAGSKIMTNEVIYSLMISYGIPIECQKWHLNRLLTLIRVCEIKNSKPTKMSKAEIMRRNAAINAQRRKKYNSRG